MSSLKKPEYMYAGSKQSDIRINIMEIQNTRKFRYLGLTISKDGLVERGRQQ